MIDNRTCTNCKHLVFTLGIKFKAYCKKMSCFYYALNNDLGCCEDWEPKEAEQ